MSDLRYELRDKDTGEVLRTGPAHRTTKGVKANFDPPVTCQNFQFRVIDDDKEAAIAHEQAALRWAWSTKP